MSGGLESAEAVPLSATAPRAWLTIVGLGEDGLDGLSHAARRAVAQAELLVGGRRHLGLVGRTSAETLAWVSPIEDTIPLILARRPAPTCVLASGDPFCFGIGSVLARHVPIGEMACFPQPSAFSLAAARLGWAQQDCALVSLCGRPLETLLPALQSGARLLVLSADQTTPAKVAGLLRESGFGPSRLTLCEAMGGPRERLRATTAESFVDSDVDPLNTIAIDVVAGPGARVLALVPGRPEALFEHDGQITKSEIRAVTLAKLAPRRGALLWDIGAGSGSVGIEWMLAHPANRAVGIERDPARVARSRRNAAALGVPGLRIVQGSAPDACAGLERPDAVFIGGGAGTSGVIDLCCEALHRGGRLVINAVTIETQSILIERFTRHGGSLNTIQTAQADPVGGFHGWRAAMPVTQWTWVKP